MKDKPGQVPSPRAPALPRITSVDQLLPMARTIVQRKPMSPFLAGLGLKHGEKVLILSDRTVDQLAVEAFATAITEAGGYVDTITLNGSPGMTEPVDLVDSFFSRNWWPAWCWPAIEAADVLITAAFMKRLYTPNLPLKKGAKPRVADFEMGDRWLLSSVYETYPVEIRDAIDKETWELLRGAREIRLTDPEGTDLAMSFAPEDWQRSISEIGGSSDKGWRFNAATGILGFPGHLMLPLPVRSVQGTFVASSLTFGGPVPRTRMVLAGGQVVQVEGGGKFGDRLRQSIEEFKDLRSPGNPGPGVNWLTTMAICTHPKAIRSPNWDKMSGSGRIIAWAHGHQRSGVIHSSIGSGLASPDYQIIRHVDTYFGTLVADGKTVIDQGHLVTLDDEKARKVAARYGEPDKLLSEDWIPAVSGVNAP